MPYGFAAAAAADIGSSLIGSSAASSAGQTEANAANAASAFNQAQVFGIEGSLAPYVHGGTNALSILLNNLGIPNTNFTGSANDTTTGQPATFNPSAPLVAPFSMSPQQLAGTPGYQFQLNQGIGAVQNSAAAQGGVNSGNTMTALTQFGQGLASNDYWNQYNAYVQQQQQQFNMLQSLSNTGQSAITQSGSVGLTGGQLIGNEAIGGANASAAGTVGAANATTGGLNSIAQLAALLSFNGGSNPGGFGTNYPTQGLAMY
jgi:hypothetical protein